MTNVGDYASTYASFDWRTPERFNFGRDVVDRWAAQDRPAMIWLGHNGEERRLDFNWLSVLSNRFANAAGNLGIERSDRVRSSSAKCQNGTSYSPPCSSSAR